MRVLAIAQRLPQRSGDGQPVRERLLALFREPGGDRGVIGGGARVGLAGQPAARRQRGAAMRGEFRQHGVILLRLGQHGDEIVVLRRRADQRRAADVDVLDAIVGGRAFARPSPRTDTG